MSRTCPGSLPAILSASVSKSLPQGSSPLPQTRLDAPLFPLRAHTPYSLVAQMVKNLPQCRRPSFDPWVGKIPWSRKGQPTPVILPGEPHEQRSLAGYSRRSYKESDTTEQLTLTLSLFATCTCLSFHPAPNTTRSTGAAAMSACSPPAPAPCPFRA